MALCKLMYWEYSVNRIGGAMVHIRAVLQMIVEQMDIVVI